MKSLMFLLQCILTDCGMRCCVSTTRDLVTVSRRSEHEGISFLTISLPSFGKDFERSLDLGYVDPSLFRGFSKSGELPRLFGGFLDLVFDRSCGRLLAEPDSDAILCIRQICLMFKKILLPCSNERERNAFVSYVQCENEVREFETSFGARNLALLDSVSSLLWGPDCSFIDRMVYEGNLLPRHGPGATADKLTGNGKYCQTEWSERLDEYFPAEQFLLPNSGFYSELGSIDFLEPGRERPVRVVSVPKTLKTPRIIAIEPTAMQYAQQSLLEVIVERLERSDYLYRSIGFTDQGPNQTMAREGSLDGSLATLDLSEASDRVSWLLVQRIFKNFPHFVGALDACRSRQADVPGFGIIPISKFASMGSAVCFPIEAMVFLTIVMVGYANKLSRPLTPKDLQILKRVRIYGDDIIVPTDMAHSVAVTLADYGFKVNTAKSFWTGKFRESCGRDYYAGDDVTVTYCRRTFPKHRRDASEMASIVSLRNQLYKAGYWTAVAFLDDQIGRIAPFPIVEETSPVLGRYSFLPCQWDKMCDKLHRPLVKGVVLRPTPRKSKLDGSGALMKFFLKRGLDPIFDVKHLERYGRPQYVDTKIGWAPIR